MPLYDYKCPKCDQEVSDVFRRMMSTHDEPCPNCGAAMAKVPSLPHTDIKEFGTPIEMYSIALDNDEQIRDFVRKTNGNIDVPTDPNDPMYGIPIARTRKQKLAALEAAGYVERN